MSEFGAINLADLQGEDQRLNAEPMEGFLDSFVPMPDVKPGQTGVVAVRILPPVVGGRLFQSTRLHLVNNRKCHCPRELKDGKYDKTPCAICDYYNALWRSADLAEKSGKIEEAEKFKEEARKLKPIERYYYNAIVRKLIDEKGEQHNVGPRILSVGKVLHKMIVRAIIGDETEPPLGDITNPKTGYDFLIKKELRGTGGDAWPNYDRSCFARDPSVLGTSEDIKKWVDNLHNLKELRIIRPNDELEREIAIHRQLIPDEKAAQGMDIAKFDEKFKTQTSVRSNLSVEDAISNVVANSSVPTANATSDVHENEDIDINMNIDLEEFKKELEGI